MFKKSKIASILLISVLLSYLCGCSKTTPTLKEFYKDASINNSYIGELTLGQIYDKDKKEFIDVKFVEIKLPENEQEFTEQVLNKEYDFLRFNDGDYFYWEQFPYNKIMPYTHSHWMVGYTQDKIPVIVLYTEATKIDTNRMPLATISELKHSWCSSFYEYGDTLGISGRAFKTELGVKYLGEIGSQGEANYKFDNHLVNPDYIPAICIFADGIWS